MSRGTGCSLGAAPRGDGSASEERFDLDIENPMWQVASIKQAVERLTPGQYSQELEQSANWEALAKQRQSELQQLQSTSQSDAMVAAQNEKAESKSLLDAKIKEKEELQLQLKQLRAQLQNIVVRACVRSPD